MSVMTTTGVNPKEQGERGRQSLVGLGRDFAPGGREGVGDPADPVPWSADA
jgi:hypothetical protein